jgi:hypothetical protein
MSTRRWGPKRSGFRAATRVALTIALAIEIAYLLVANVIVSGWLRKWVNGDEAALKLDFASAWSPWPGRVYARDLLLRVQDTNIQFELRIAAVEVDVALTGLLGRTFRATHVDIDGLRYRFRHKLEEPAKHPALVRALPPIEGFSDPPTLVPQPPQPRDKLWTIHITGVDALIEELWVQQFRSTGAGHVTGGFRLEPTRRLEVEGGLALEPGPLHVGPKQLVAKRFGGRISASIPDLDVERLKGADVFQGISTHVDLRADLESLEFLDTVIEPAEVVLREGAGPLAIDVRLNRGELRPPSSVRYSSRRIEVYASSHRLRGDAALKLEVTPEQRGRLWLSAERLTWNDTRARVDAPVVASRPRLELETRTLAVHRRFEASGGRLELPELRADDLRSLARIAPQKVRIRAGALAGSAEAKLEGHGALAGKLALSFDRAALAWDGTEVEASGSFSTAFRQPDVLGPSSMLEGVKLVIQRGRLGTRDGNTGFGWLRAASTRVPLSSFVPERATVRLTAGFPDAKPVLQAFGIATSGLAATAAGVLDLSDLEVGAVVGVERGAIDVGLERARTDAVQARGRWRSVGGNERGAFLLTTDLVNIGLEIDGGETRVHPLASESWLDRALADLGRDVRRENPLGLRPAPARAVP